MKIAIFQKWWFWLVCSFLLYANTLNHEYTIDDLIVVTSNNLTQKGITGIPEIFKHSYLYGYDGREDESYRPLTLATFALEKSMFDAKSSGSHFIQVILYGICVLLLFRFLSKLFYDKKPIIAIVITGLFVMHPIHTEVVANVKSRDELLCALFLFGSLNFYVSWIDSRKVIHLFWTLFFFFCSTLSKETAVLGIILFPVTYYFIKGLKIKEMIKISLFVLMPFGVYFFIRSQVLSNVLIEDPINPVANSLAAIKDSGIQLATNFSIFSKYIQLSIFPLEMSWDYSIAQIPQVGFGSLSSILGVFFLSGLIILSIWGLVRKNKIGFGAIFFLTTFILTSNFFFLINCNLGERFLFLPVLGTIIILVLMLEPLMKRLPRNGIIVFVGIIFISFIARTFTRSNDWKNNLSIYESGVIVSPKSVKAHFNLGTEYLQLGNRSGLITDKRTFYDKAVNEFITAKNIYAEYDNIYENLAYVLVEMSKIETDTIKKKDYLYQGLKELDHAIVNLRLQKQAIFQNQYAILENLIKLSDSPVEQEDLKYKMIATVELNKNKSAEDIQRIIYYSKDLQENNKVLDYSETLIVTYPDKSSYILQLSQDYFNAKEYELSLKLQTLYVKNNPSDLSAKSNLGMLYEILGKKEKAKKIYEEILQVNPNEAHTKQLYENLK